MKEVKFSFSAGALIRGQIKREVESFLFMNTKNYTIKEQKGLFDSEFFVSFTCEDEKAESIYYTIVNRCKSISEG